MKLSIVSTHRGRHFLLFLTDTLVRSLEAAHVRRRTKTIQRKHSLWKHILLFTHCRPRSRAQKLPSNSLSLSLSLSHEIELHQQSDPQEFPSFSLWEEESHTVPSHVFTSGHTFFFFFLFHCRGGFQLSFSWQSPGYSLFCFRLFQSFGKLWLVFWKHVRQSDQGHSTNVWTPPQSASIHAPAYSHYISSTLTHQN